MKRHIEDIYYHVKGESLFVDDLPEPNDITYATIFTSPIAHGRVKRLDITKALECDGVIDIVTYKDIPGQNEIGSIYQDEPLLVSHTLDVIGQPIAIIIAESPLAGRRARKEIVLEYEEYTPVTDPRVAFREDKIIAPPRTFVLGDTDSVWESCDVVIVGNTETSGQEHLYLETQIAMVIPGERENYKIYSSTQNPSSVQKISARILGISMNSIEVDVLRLGGAFGGKEEQGNTFACLALMGSYKTGRPVKLLLPRDEDMVMTGKRHPYSSDFKIGLRKDGTILAYEVDFYQNSGSCADLSTSVLERTLYHCTNSYYIPNVKATATPCYTNMTSFTAFRGFGGPQGMFVIEAAINRAAVKLGVTPEEIQRKNLIKDGDEFPYGMKVENCQLGRTFQRVKDNVAYDNKLEEIERYNKINPIFKKGLYIMPVTFGISFTTLFLNQAGALVHVYNDGSISVSTGAIEMGQGVNMKIQRVVAETFSVSMDRIRLETTNTSRVANTSPTAASAGADMNGRAAEIGAREILQRLLNSAAKQLKVPEGVKVELKDEYIYVDGKKTSLGWEELVWNTYFSRVNLSSQAYYAVPDLWFDKTTEKGKPFAYHTYGTALFEITLDTLRGIYHLDAINIVHDVGRSLNKKVDLGQIEGGTIQGIGWLTTEELLYGEKGELKSKTLSTYKIPDIKFVPDEFNVEFLEDADNPHAVLKSKAVGEPPFMYGIGVYFAIINLIQQINPNKEIEYHTPITPEKVLMNLYK